MTRTPGPLAGRATRLRAGPRGVVLAAALALATVAGCSADVQDHDLCGAYSSLVASVQDLKNLDPGTAGLDELRRRAGEVQDQLDQLQATSEGQLDSAISALRADVADLKEAAVDAGTQALDTARPLVEDALTTVGQAYARLQELADAQCSTP